MNATIQFLKTFTRNVVSEYDDNDEPTVQREIVFQAGEKLDVEFVESDMDKSVVIIEETGEVLELTSDEFESVYEPQASETDGYVNLGTEQTQEQQPEQ